MIQKPKKSGLSGAGCMLIMGMLIIFVMYVMSPSPLPVRGALHVDFENYKNDENVNSGIDWHSNRINGLVLDLPSFSNPWEIDAPYELRGKIVGGKLHEILIQKADWETSIQHAEYVGGAPDPVLFVKGSIVSMEDFLGGVQSEPIIGTTISGCEAALGSIEWGFEGDLHVTKCVQIAQGNHLWSINLTARKNHMEMIWPRIKNSISVAKE